MTVIEIEALGLNATLGWRSLRELLETLAALRGMDQPFTSPEGWQQVLRLIERLAELAGVEEVWLERLRKFAADEALLAILAAVAEYLWLLRSSDGSALPPVLPMFDTDDRTVEALAIEDWLPLLLEIVALLRTLRAAA